MIANMKSRTKKKSKNTFRSMKTCLSIVTMNESSLKILRKKKVFTRSSKVHTSIKHWES